jgi:hypothetical protein
VRGGPSNNRLEGTVMRLWVGASGAERLCALGTIRPSCAAPQHHR